MSFHCGALWVSCYLQCTVLEILILCFPVSSITSFILFSPVNEHVAHEDNASWPEKMLSPQYWAAAVECSGQPRQGKSGTFVAMDLCWPCTTRMLGASFLQLPPAPGRQSEKGEFPHLMTWNLFLLAMPWGRGEQKNSYSHLGLTGRFP